jgi:molybdate transport system substrate-binding protein
MKWTTAFLLVLALALPARAVAADLLIAQAANFTAVMQNEIIPAFEKATGLTVQATYASTGKLYGQIVSGAPFDMLLAADESRPAKLHADGLAQEPFVYARGQVVLWSRDRELCADGWKAALQNPAVKKIAIANTETAPYGTSSMKALQAAGLWEAVQPRLAFGQSITQAFQFAYTGAADVGFVAYSSVFTDEGGQGCHSLVDEAPPVVQAACILTNAPNPEAAARFVEFLASPEVQAFKRQYGYR